ncbi:MAG: hypothetical protein WCG25_09820, partial [bacterium]
VCKIIIQKTFEIPLKNDLHLVFEKRGVKSQKDYIYEILERKGSQMNAKEICKVLQEKCPNKRIIETSVRSIITNNKKLFISFSRTSTYGLKEWEQQNNNIKGGSIRSITVEFLQKQNTPMFCEDIAKYVLRYRKSNHHSVINNIQQDTSKIFRYFKGGYIGLSSKTYDEKNLNYKQLRSGQLSNKELQPLIGQHLDDIISHFVSKLGNTEAQVDHVLKMLINKKFIILSPDNILISVAPKKKYKPRKPKQKDSE